MFPTWRLKIREARLALNAGRPVEAGQILQQESVREFLPAKRLSCEVAQRLVSRSEQHLRQGDSVASWSDLEHADRLGGCEERVTELRQAQVQRGLERMRSFLVRGETHLAAEQIKKLEQRRLGGNQRRTWKLIVHLISRAKELSDQGQATAAAEMLGRASRALPDPHDELAEMLATRQVRLKRQAEEQRHLSKQLHETLLQEAWTEVLATAEALLELAPAHKAARQARQRAWQAAGMEATQVPVRSGSKKQKHQLASGLKSTHAWVSSAKGDTKIMAKEASKRWVTWIDGVGGYLICMSEEVVLGQPTEARGAEIPILADLSRRHATIRREGESYVLTPVHRVRVNGIELTGAQVLKDAALIELGDSVRLRFRKPHALSGTAVLTLESHHKTEPAVDSIILMSESCVLGTQPQSHIRCRDWSDDLVLFRRGDDLQYRTEAKVSVFRDGLDEGVDREPATSGGVITDTTRIDGESFSLSFEEV